MKIRLQFLKVVAVPMILSFGAVAGQFPKPDASELKSKTQVAKIQISKLENAVVNFALDIGRFPTIAEGLKALVNKPGKLKEWGGPYIDQAELVDPWDRVYVYRCPGKHSEFDLFSYGRDGVEGGEGEDADIGNWLPEP
jgi:general secretion pathway protein G